MVCVAGLGLLNTLKVPRQELQPVSGLRDVTDKHFKCFCMECTFTANGESTTQPVYLVCSAKTTYLSFAACKGLSLLPQGFPHTIHTTASPRRRRATTAVR